MKKEQIQLYVAAIGGAFLLVIIDLMTNIDAATTLKIGGVMEKYLFGPTGLGPGLIGLALVLAISVFLCWLNNPKDKAAAFTRGLSIFAVLSAVTPYSVINDTASTGQTTITSPQAHNETSMISLVSSAYAQDNRVKMQCRPGTLKADATLISKKYVSSCKPYYSGVLGLGSFFNNTIEYCESPHTLPKNEKVKLLRSWESGFRGYRYSEIEFQVGNQICTGWVSDGRKTTRHVIRD